MIFDDLVEERPGCQGPRSFILSGAGGLVGAMPKVYGALLAATKEDLNESSAGVLRRSTTSLRWLVSWAMRIFQGGFRLGDGEAARCARDRIPAPFLIPPPLSVISSWICCPINWLKLWWPAALSAARL